MGSQDFEVEGCKASGSESEIDWITLDEVNRLIYESRGDAAPDDADGFLTSFEWADHWGVHERTAQRKIAKLARIGKVESRSVIRQSPTTNRSYQCYAYKLVLDKTD